MISVTYAKLAKYCELSRGYSLERDGERVLLSFVPYFPEALEKTDLPPPKVWMIGTAHGDKVEFSEFATENIDGIHSRNLDEAELIYKGWFDYIEENY